MSRGHELLGAVSAVKHQAEDVIDVLDAWGLGGHKVAGCIARSMRIAVAASDLAVNLAEGELDKFPEPEGTRRGNFILTASGRRFWPLDPRPEDVSIGDMAWALAFKCRWGGFPRTYHSVAEHSLNVARIAQELAERDGFPSPEVAGDYGAVHDCEEAYLPDIPRPVKASIKGWPKIAATVQDAIHDALGLPPPPVEVAAYVQTADDIALELEKRALFPPGHDWSGDRVAPTVDVPEWADLLPLMGGDFERARVALRARLERIAHRHRVAAPEPAPSAPSASRWRAEVKPAAESSSAACRVCGAQADPIFQLCAECVT